MKGGQIGLDAGEVLDLPKVEPIAGMDLESADVFRSGGLQVQVDDAVTLEREIGEQTGFKIMYSAESQFFIIVSWLVDPFVLVFLEMFPSDQ